MQIISAQPQHEIQCRDILIHSPLGETYFSRRSQDEITQLLQQAVKNVELFAAVDSDGICLGFVWAHPRGAFQIYPYIHMLVVKEGFRGRGVGTELLRYCEDVWFADAGKLFLVVGEHNVRARRLYERLDYVQVGRIPGLYREDIVECLMMKSRPIEG